MALSGIISERGSDSLILDSSGRYRGETIVHNCEPQDLFRAIVLRKYTKKIVHNCKLQDMFRASTT